MRTLVAAASAAILIGLAGCGGEPAQEAETNITVPEGDTVQRLRDMPEGQRNGVFIRAIRDAGRDCQHVDASSEFGEVNGSPAWTARCEDGTQWVVMIGRDGIATVANRAELEAASGIAPSAHAQ